MNCAIENLFYIDGLPTQDNFETNKM